MTLNHTLNYRWAFKQSSTPFTTGVIFSEELAIEIGSDLSAGIDWNAANKTFVLDGVTITMTADTTGGTIADTLAELVTRIDASSLTAADYIITSVVTTDLVVISKNENFTLAEGDGALAQLGWTAAQYVSGAGALGTIDLSAGIDWSAGTGTPKDFILDGLTVNLTTDTNNITEAIAAISAAITAAGLYDFTVSADSLINNFIHISSPYSFELEAGSADALAGLGWTAAIYTGASFDEENGTTSLPFFMYNKERKYGSAGRVKNPVKSKDHKDCSFPMLMQTDTFISAAITDQEAVGSAPTLFQQIWTDGLKIYNGENCYISEYKLDLAPKAYPTQTVQFQMSDVVVLALATNIPYCTNIPPQDTGDFTIELDTAVMSDVTNVSLTVTPGIDPNILATSFVRGNTVVQMKDVTLEITSLDSSLSAVYDTAQSKIATAYQLEVICELGTLESTAMNIQDITRNELTGEPGNYEYVMTFMNGFGDVIRWT